MQNLMKRIEWGIDLGGSTEKEKYYTLLEWIKKIKKLKYRPTNIVYFLFSLHIINVIQKCTGMRVRQGDLVVCTSVCCRTNHVKFIFKIKWMPPHYIVWIQANTHTCSTTQPLLEDVSSCVLILLLLSLLLHSHRHV